MKTLYFEKISQFDRQTEPVTVSIPFARGALTDVRHLAIRDGATVLPAQRRPLATWDDGSIKWLLVHFQPDLPGNKDKTLHFDVTETPVEAAVGATVTVTETESGLVVDTGPLSFLVPNEGFWPIARVALNGQPVWGATPFQGFTLAGVTIIQPKNKPRGRELTAEDKENNQLISRIRIRVEHAIGGVKRYRIVKDKLRNWKRNFRDKIMETCCGLHNFRLYFRPWHSDTL